MTNQRQVNKGIAHDTHLSCTLLGLTQDNQLESKDKDIWIKKEFKMRDASSKLWWFRQNQHWQILKKVQIESEGQDTSSHPEGLGQMLMTTGWRSCQNCDLFVACESPEADHVNLIATNKMDDVMTHNMRLLYNVHRYLDF